jgi:CO/xanthine dehydrogenase Mo-binding subunit
VLAAVAAETRHAAREAAALVEVEYEVLDPVTTPFEYGARELSRSVVELGDVDAALAGAAHVVSERFRTQFIEHAFLEPEAALVVPEADGGVHVYSQGQGIWDDRRQLASLLALEEDAVHVTHVPTGGGFGAKEDLGVQGHAAVLALAAERPVSLRISRAESLRYHAKRHAMWLDYTAGCDEEGRLGSSATPAPTPASATRCSSAPPATPAAPTRSRTSTSRRARSTPTILPAARCAASASTSPTSRWRGSSTAWPSGWGSTAGRSASGTRSSRGSAQEPARSSARASG